MSLEQIHALLDRAEVADERERVVLLANAGECLRALPQDDPAVAKAVRRRANLVLRSTNRRLEE